MSDDKRLNIRVSKETHDLLSQLAADQKETITTFILRAALTRAKRLGIDIETLIELDRPR